MTLLISAVLAVLTAQAAFAERGENKPFNTVNGRTTLSGPASTGPRGIKVTAPGGGAAANLPGAGEAPAVTNAMISGAPSSGGRSYIGRGSQAPRSVSGATRRGGRTFWGGKARKTDGGEGETEEAPPHFSKPGALIRTTGHKVPLMEPTETRTHTVDAGEIAFNNRKAINVGRAPSIQEGAKDTPPPPNPDYYNGRGYGTGAGANSPAGSGSSGNNNGSGNNGRDKPGDDDDQHGGDKRMIDAFNAAF